MNTNEFTVANTILEVLNKQEQMHSLNMQLDRSVGAEVMLFANGRLVIEPTLSLSGEELNFGEEEIDFNEVKTLLESCSTSFRETFNTAIKNTGKIKVMRITTKAITMAG